jgi:ribonuclease HI
MTKRRMVMVVADENGTVLRERKRPGGSNNIAELEAVRDALEWCVDHQVRRVEIRTDSRNTLAWVFGRKVGKKLNDLQTVLQLRAEVAALRARIDLRMTWVPRDVNTAGIYIEGRYGV